MVVTNKIAEVASGVYSTVLAPCSCRVLVHLLGQGMRIVWVVSHMPSEVIQWAEFTVPLTDRDSKSLKVRGLKYDFQMPENQFVSLLPALESYGITLLLMDRNVPDTLQYDTISKMRDPYPVLKSNGWSLTFDLPHSGDYGAVTTTDRTLLSSLLARTPFKTGALP